ncbi:MAG: nucleotidyl transferase AbiEii/AbiGii toxin family protein [Anaerolineae bacterium]
MADRDLGIKISVGGAIGLLHYWDYRPTHDVDAWWNPAATLQERQEVISVIRGALQTFGRVQERSWGDVVSIELLENGKRVFSFQIVERSGRLRLPISAPWRDVLLDSFPDLVASKVVALVERGAPRDFRDISALCQAGLTDPAQAWRWWRERQQLSGSDIDLHRARLAVTTHLVRIAQHRPLAGIADLAERASAEQVRQWFAGEFLDALVD